MADELGAKGNIQFCRTWVTASIVFGVFMKRNCLHLVNKAAVSLLLFLCVTELWYNINYTRNVMMQEKNKKIRTAQKCCVLFPAHACVAYVTERYVAARCVALLLRCVLLEVELT